MNRKKMEAVKTGLTVFVLMLLLAMPAIAGNDNQVRPYPGWNGSGSVMTGPISGTVSDAEWDNSDDGEDEPWAITYAQGWKYSPAGWWYQYSTGAWPSDGWKYIDARWYRFSQGGHIVTGWFTDEEGSKYYLNPVDDGTFGSLRIGWQLIDGKAYYFNTMSDGTLGRLLINTTTPDGYRVGADGAMIPQS